MTEPNRTIADLANQKILDLWYDPKHSLAAKRPRMPMVYPEFPGGGLVVLSLNPSFSATGFQQFLKEPKWKGFAPEVFYAWRDRREHFDLMRAREIEARALANYRFFRPFEALANKVGVAWQHLDLFAIRETSDEEALVWVGADKGASSVLKSLNAFGRAQVEWCTGILEQLKPKVVVVPNVTAALIIAERLGASFDQEAGHRWASIAGRQVPVFMSSMWTGARALDRFSKELLQWHILKALRPATKAGGAM